MKKQKIDKPLKKSKERCSKASIKPTIINMLKVFWRAHKDASEEKFGRDAKRHSNTRHAVTSGLNIEMSMIDPFQAEVDKLRNGSISQFIFQIEPSAYPYFGSISKSEAFADLNIKESGNLKYVVTLHNLGGL